MTTLLASLWQGVAIAMATAVLLRLSPRLNAATRYIVWWMALAAVIALPIAHFFFGPEISELETANGLTIGQAGQALVLPTPPDWMIACLAGIWLGTVLLGLGRVAAGLAHVAAIRRRSRPLNPSIARRLTLWNQLGSRRRPAELRASSDIAGACALGLFGPPVIALSDRLIATLADDSLDQIVLHEQAHLSRYDDWTTLAQACIRALLGLHPAVRIIDRRIDVEREATCDDVVVMRTGGAARYAHCLAQAADAVAAESRMLAAMMPNATGTGGLLVRVQRLLDPRVPRHARLQLTVAAIGFLAFTAADAAAPSVRPVVIADAMALLPVIHGEPTHRAYDWQSRAARTRQLPDGDAYWTPASPRVARPPTTTASASSTDLVEPLPISVLVRPVAESSDDPPVSEPSLLHSRALPSAITLTAARSLDDNDSAWTAAARAGAALGGSFAQMGTATGTRSKRAGSAVGGFFSRAGKAVANSF